MAAAARGSYNLALYRNALRGNPGEHQVEKHGDKRQPSDRYPAAGGHERNSLSSAKQ
jgi:hypothetical protein